MFFQAKHATYHVEVYGQGEPLVLLHGFTGTGATWRASTELLAKHFRLYALDMPGHGRTTSVAPVTMEAFAEDLQQLMLEWGFGSCHVVGYSMGGRAALAFALQYPHFVRSLVLESASPGLAPALEQEARSANDDLLAKRIEELGIEQFVDYWEQIPLFQSQRTLPVAVQQSIRQERLSQQAAGLAASLRAMGTGAQPSFWEQLQTLSMPVLLLAGMLDTKFVRIQAQMHAAIKTSQIYTFQETGHAIHVENPKKFDKVVLEFLLACT